MKSIMDVLDRQIAEITKKTRHDRELQITRAYLRHLELGYSADDLCIYEWPAKVSVNDGSVHYSQKYYLGLKAEPPPFESE